MKKIGFIGTGNMARAMINGLKETIFKNYIYGFDKDKSILNKVKKLYNIKITESSNELVKSSDIIILAVKPQNMDEVLNEIKDCVFEKKLIISIAAGIKINYILKKLNKEIPIIRVMPNTPALIGEGAGVYSVNKYVEKSHIRITSKILKSFCKIFFKLKENEINAITALSGSGPAYFFYFLEAMSEAARLLKINNKISLPLIAQTMIGAGKMILSDIGTPEDLRIKVTSKGGTTERAIQFFERNNLKNIIKKAILFAKKRADELSNINGK